MTYTSIELFAGAGGMALGLEAARIHPLILNDYDAHCCATLRANRPSWNVAGGDISKIDFTAFAGVDLVSGGFPCQSFSHAGKRLGFEDTRGTAFYDYARCVKQSQPIVFVAENVRGLVTHDEGNTLAVIVAVFKDLGYTIQWRVLNSNDYRTPQSRERVVIVGVRNDIKSRYTYPVKIGGGVHAFRRAYSRKDLQIKCAAVAAFGLFRNKTRGFGVSASGRELAQFAAVGCIRIYGRGVPFRRRKNRRSAPPCMVKALPYINDQPRTKTNGVLSPRTHATANSAGIRAGPNIPRQLAIQRRTRTAI